MKVKIRQAVLGDLDDILKLNLLLFKEDYRYDKTLNMGWTYSADGKNYFKERVTSPNGCALVAEVGSKVVGYAVGGSQEGKGFRVKARYVELENMLVLEEFRGQGIGGKLANEFLSWCKDKEVNYVSVTASAQNQLGVRFYKNLGFDEYETTLEKRLKASQRPRPLA